MLPGPFDLEHHSAGSISPDHNRDKPSPRPPPRIGGSLVNLSPSHPTPTASGVSVSQPPEPVSNDLHETNDHDHTSYPTQRQQYSTSLRSQQSFQHRFPDPVLESVERLSTPASSAQRSLRRTPRFESAPSPSPASSEPRQVHIAAASIGFSPSPVPFARTRPDSSVSGLSSSLFEDGARLKESRELKEGLDQEPLSDRLDSQHHSKPLTSSHQDRPEPHRAVRVSRNTHSAILFALEEALRHPNPFTPDLVEESAEMADLMAAPSGIPATSNGNGITAPRRPTAGPAPTSSPSGIRGPRMIMQERAAREARQRAEAEQLALERGRAEQEARLLEESRRRNAERRTAGVATGSGSGPEQHHPNTRGHGPAVQEATKSPQASGTVPVAKAPTEHREPTQFATNIPQQPPQSPTYVTSSGRPRPQQQPANIGTVSADQGTHHTDPTKPRNSFPHAFERWETLSAHWEGLTSYWIRKLEQNKDDINRDPLSQQLARQVTDLSAAGANLFHAVVELQRLRASSERKFQRWFFETRAELERAQEVNGMLEKALERERRDRSDAIRDAIDHERGTSKAQKQLSEMRKELAISKEEARRAWEELGRKEQEERDRTLSLQSGQPTIVGGVQVVPMTQGGPSRQGTTRETGAYQGEYAQGYGPEHSQALSSAPTSPPVAGPSGTYHKPQEHGQRHGGGRAGGSEGGFSEGEYIIDATGNFVLDSRGQKIPFVAAPPSGASVSDPEADDYDTPATTNPPSGAHEPTSTSAGEGRWTGTYSDPQDYSGQGYGAPGWETVPRHHHPTRLSDVIEEEDERSRTSASQSRGI